MLNSEITLHSSAFPPGFQRNFDAHIYYTEETRSFAISLRDLALVELAKLPVFVGALCDFKVGPHPVPMFEINFPKALYSQMLSWLNGHRGRLNVLVHEVTGDDPKDHSEGAIWLGERLELDTSKLDPSPYFKCCLSNRNI